MGIIMNVRSIRKKQQEKLTLFRIAETKKHIILLRKESKKMKNVIKKITAAAMAFTLLVAGSAAIKSAAPQTDSTITASAATVDRNTPHLHGQFAEWRVVTPGHWVNRVYHVYNPKTRRYITKTERVWVEPVKKLYCLACDCPV